MTPDQTQDTVERSSLGTARTEAATLSSPARRTELAATTRFDPPHETPSVVQELAATGQVPAGAEPARGDAFPEQLRLQADQLGAHLARRQEDLDRREAELNSRLARFESEARAARLWLSQRESDLGSRSDALAKQQNEVAKQLEQLGATEAERKARLSALAAEKEDEMRRTLTSLAAQKNRLDEADSRLAAALAETQQLQQQLSRRRTAMEEETAALRDQIAAEHRQALADLEQKRQAVQRRAEQVDRCNAALKQLRGELSRMHRETLDIRLATEETWVQLSGRAPPAALTRSLGVVRAQLAEQHRQAESELIQQKQELETLRRLLVHQHATLVEQKRRFEQWATSRQEELQRYASRLVAREQQLLRGEAQYGEQRQSWHTERIKYQQELRRLQGELALQGSARASA